MGKLFKIRGKNKRLFGVTKLDTEIMWHRAKHGPMLEPEVLARCPICKADHRIFYFKCSCGDPFFCHLQNEEKDLKKWPTGKWQKGAEYGESMEVLARITRTNSFPDAQW